MSKLKTVFKMYREIAILDKHAIPALIFCTVSNSVLPFFNIYFTAKIITLLSGGGNLKSLIINIILALIFNFVFSFLSGYLSEVTNMSRSMLFAREDNKMARVLYNTDYEKLSDSNFREVIHKHEEAGASRWARFSYFMWTTSVFVTGVLTLIISVVMIIPLLKIGFTKTGNSFFENPLFLITLIAVIAVMAVVMLLIAIKMNKSYLAANEAYAELDRLFYAFINIFGDYKTGKEIRIYKEQDLISHIATNRILTDGEKTLKQISMRTAKTSSVVAVMGAAVAFGVYVFIGVKGNLGLFDIGSLVMYCGAFMQIINGVMQIANTLGKLAEILPLANVYFEIVETKDDKYYGSVSLNPSDNFDIEFKNVSFKYPGADDYALNNVNLKIDNGKHIAVVGRNGSGKTTFIKLMCRLYDVTDGEILINGVNIKEYTKESIVNFYSVVFQDFKLFSISLKDNVCGAVPFDKNKFKKCLDEANVLERVENMPFKEQTCLYKDTDSNGIEISGGEAQKIALARALYKDSPVVVLDEPTAVLDPIAENEIYAGFNSFVKNKTAIYISHRLSSCVFCDEIVVFDKAKLVESGTHNDLLKRNGLYSELWNAQAKYYV